MWVIAPQIKRQAPRAVPAQVAKSRLDEKPLAIDHVTVLSLDIQGSQGDSGAGTPPAWFVVSDGSDFPTESLKHIFPPCLLHRHRPCSSTRAVRVWSRA